MFFFHFYSRASFQWRCSEQPLVSVSLSLLSALTVFSCHGLFLASTELFGEVGQVELVAQKLKKTTVSRCLKIQNLGQQQGCPPHLNTLTMLRVCSQ